MKDITDRFDLTRDEYVSWENGLGSKIKRVSSAKTYCWVCVPKGKSIYADVAKFNANSKWSTGQIIFTDSENICLSAIAPDSETSHAYYTRFELKFPVNAAYAYVNSSINFPPKIYKKVL